MVLQKETTNKLREFGLNTYESRMWVALLSRGTSTAGELSDIANVPRSRSYDVLESLSKKGFVEVKRGKLIKYIAISPDQAIENLKKKTTEETEKKLQEAARGAVEELIQLHNKSVGSLEQHDLIGLLKGRKNLYNQFLAVTKQAKTKLTLILTPKGAIEMGKHIKTLKSLNSKGVKIKIFAQAEKDNKTTLEELSKYAKIKETKVDIRACIVDKREIVFGLFDDKSVNEDNDGGIWFISSKFAESLEKEMETK